MTRWKASELHFLLSLFIAVVAVIVAILVMYHPHIPVVLGPLITLVIFKQGKPGLKFDLRVIAVLQIVALSYGLYMIDQHRPMLVGTQLSGDVDERNEVLMSALHGGPAVDSMPQYYGPYEG